MSLKKKISAVLSVALLLQQPAFSEENAQVEKVDIAKVERRELQSVLLLDEVAKALRLCNKKMPLDQKLTLYVMGKILKEKKYAQDRSIEVKNYVLAENEKEYVKSDAQYQSHRLRGISADGNKTITFKRKKMSWSSKIMLKLAKYVNEKKMSKEGRYYGKCVDALGKKRGKCDGAVTTAYDFLTSQKEKAYPKMSLKRHPDRQSFIAEVRKKVLVGPEGSCSSRNKKKISKRCGKFLGELEENRVACEKFTDELKKRRAFLDIFLNTFMATAYAKGPIDREMVRNDILNNARSAAQEWSFSTEGRDALLGMVDGSLDDKDVGLSQVGDDFRDQVNVSIDQMDKLNKNSNSGKIQFDSFSSDYSLKGVDEIDKMLNGITFSKADLNELGLAAAELSKHTLAKNDVQNFVSAYRKSALTNKDFPSPKFENVLESKGRSVLNALKAVRSPFDGNGLPKREQQYLKWANARRMKVASAFKSDFEAAELKKVLDYESRLKSGKTLLASASPVQNVLGASRSEEDDSIPSRGHIYSDSSDALNLKGGSGDMESDEEIDEEVDPYGFALSDDSEEDQLIKERLLSRGLDPKGKVGISSETEKTLWEIVSRRYVRSAYPRFIKKRKKR